MLTEIDHVAIAVRDLDAAIAWYRDALGAEVEHRETVEHDGVEEALLRVAESYVHADIGHRDESPVARFLRGGARVCTTSVTGWEDCASRLPRMVQRGRPHRAAPRPGSPHTTIAFITPRSLRHLIELVEDSGGITVWCTS